tara:strand:+ start:1601 stop:1942 length:342 start_codon:yes stop_codon:yes gene_type:complete
VDEYPIEDWNDLSSALRAVFEDLGNFQANTSSLEFTSYSSDVATGVSITSEGNILASMPLHGIESRFDRVRIDERKESIRFIGPDMDYTYRIPPAILRRREKLRGLSRLWRQR